jgi:hypothetical protein
VDERQYRLDREDVIQWVDRGWDAFAARNGAPSLVASAVVGRPLFDFLTGSETRHIYTMLLRGVRESGQPVSVPFRCDAPTLRRSMELTIAPETAGALLLSTRLIDRAEQPEVALLAADPARAGDCFLLMCSWCKRVEVEGAWSDVEAAVQRLRLFELATLPQITHGMCPACEQEIRARYALA